MDSVVEKTKQGLLENGRDSVRTALLHFSDMQIDNRGEYHHTKWVNVCAYHAAECISNLILLENDPANDLLKIKNGEYEFPHLDTVLGVLKSMRFKEVLTDSERKLCKLFGKLSNNRHRYMHRIAPDNADMSAAAVALLGILRVLKNRKGIKTSDLLDMSPPIENEIASAIKLSHARSYESYVALAMKEDGIRGYLEHCPNCDLHTVYDAECWACFEEFESAYCTRCDVSTIYLSWLPQSGESTINCQECNSALAI